MPASPFPPRTNSSRALRRALVADGSAGSSRNTPVVLARKIASYCRRFSAVMSAALYVMTVVHAPVFCPSASIVRVARGIDACTKPSALASTSSRRGCFGLAGAVSGNAAIIWSRSDTRATWG